MGSGAVSLNRDCPPTCKVSIVNEKELGIYDFWKVLADKEQGKELMGMLSKVKGNREVFNKAHWTVKYPPKGISRAEYAECVYLETALSYSGLRGHYGKQRKERDFQNMVDKHMNPAYEKFQKERVKVLNWDMLDLLREIAKQPAEVQEGIMLYLDPPYLFDVRAKNACKAYKHEMLLPYGYQCYFGGRYRKTCSKKKTEDGVEYLWCNYELPKGALYIRGSDFPSFPLQKSERISVINIDRIYKDI